MSELSQRGSVGKNMNVAVDQTRGDPRPIGIPCFGSGNFRAVNCGDFPVGEVNRLGSLTVPVSGSTTRAFAIAR